MSEIVGYVSVYDIGMDITFQVEADVELFEAAKRSLCRVSVNPFPDLEILPRNRSERDAIILSRTEKVKTT